MEEVLPQKSFFSFFKSKPFLIFASVSGLLFLAGAAAAIFLTGGTKSSIVGEITGKIDGTTQTAAMKLVAGESIDNQGCQGTGTVMFGASPMRIQDIGNFLPYGEMVGAHVTPIDHMYISPIIFKSPRDSYEVRAIGDGIITAIGQRTQQVGDGNNGQAKPAEYQLKFWYSCDFASYYDLLTSLSPKLQAEFDSHRENGNQSARVQVKVKEGEVVGKIGGQTVDFAVYDYTKILPGFIVPEHYLAESWKLHVVDPYQYFKEPIRTQLLALNPRSAEPRQGKIDYDIDGKLVGTWFKVGSNGFNGSGRSNQTPWRGHLSFVYDAIDPTALVISIGDYAGVSQQFGVKDNAPDPKTIDQASGLRKYELGQLDHYRTSTGQSWDREHPFPDIKARPQAQVSGVVLVQVLSTRQIKFQAFPGKTAAQVSGFDDSAILYER